MKLSKGKLSALIIALVIVIDQVTKIWVKTHFYIGEQVDVTSWFKLLFIENNGMAFGMELGSKLLLTTFRILASAGCIYYLWRLRSRLDIPKGYVACIALFIAGALGNVIDCIAYGLIFNSPIPPQVAQMFPPGGGYSSLFNGRVVDMLYFPLCEWNWPQWMPWIGGNHFVFFQPIFNVADASLSIGVISLLLFYPKQIVAETSDKNEDTENTENPGILETPEISEGPDELERPEPEDSTE